MNKDTLMKADNENQGHAVTDRNPEESNRKARKILQENILSYHYS